MDGNKDDAVKCLRIGQKALKDGDKTRAYKFLSKAGRLDPSLPLKDLLSSLSEEIEEETASDNTSTRENEQEVEKSRRRETSRSDGAMNGQHEAKAAADFSGEQADVVRRIRKTKEYYQILGLNKECSAEEVRKAYRKLSLKVHPDKNKAPGAEEAFKSVSKAFACLSDEDQRKRYDQFGPEENHEVAQQHYARRYRSNGFYDEAFDADEIFNSFFFGSSYSNTSFQRAQFVRTRAAAGQGVGAGARTQEVQFGTLINLLQLLPVLALILISFFPFSRPVYSLDQVAPYHYQHFTPNEVPFFVKSQTFDKEYPPGTPSRRNIEAQIDRDYREILGYNCRIELGRRNWNPSLRTPSCDRLKQLSVY